MVEKLDKHKPSLNLTIMTNDGIPTCIMAMKTELASIVEAREDVVK
jgi:hypothetical protein